METVYKKESKEVVTTYNLGKAIERNGTREGERLLQITTSKGYNGGIRTTAMVSFHGDGFYTHAFDIGNTGNGDFRKDLQQYPCARVTEKALLAGHENVRYTFNDVLALALAHYGLTTEQYLKQG